jgi:PAS domain S-box-containing protein
LRRLAVPNIWKPGQLEQFPLVDLPIATYLVEEDGTLLEGNRRLREMLKLPRQGTLTGVSLAVFYKNHEQRAQLLSRARDASQAGRWLEKATAIFSIEGEERSVQVYCGLVQSPDAPERFLGCLIDVSEEETLKETLDRLPVGIFQLAANGELLHVNPFLCRFLGFEDQSQVLGKRLTDFLVDPADFETLRSELGKNGVARKERIELRRNRASFSFWANLSASTLSPSPSESASIVGTLRDVSDREVLRELLETAPVGIYEVLYDEGQHCIVECNKTFATMFDHVDPESLKGKDIRSLYQESITHDRFLEELRKLDEEGQPLRQYKVNIVLHSGRAVTFIIDAKLLRDKYTGEERGRIGVLSDITRFENADRPASIIKKDVGYFLHDYDRALTSFRSRLPAIRQSLALAYERRAHGAEDLSTLLEKLTSRLIEGIELDLLPQEGVEGRSEALSAASWKRLRSLVGSIRRNLKLEGVVALQLASYHSGAAELGSILEEGLHSQRLQRDKIKELLRLAVQAAAVGALLAIDKTAFDLGGVTQASRALREVLTSGTRTLEPPRVFSLEAIVEQALQQVSDYAADRRITIRSSGIPKNVRINVVERDMVRALSNIFHNAVKYSWSHELQNPGWVSYKAERFGETVNIEIENYGVPITAGEIEKGKPFEMGYRGSLSLDRGRPGTGIGLADAKAVVMQAGGVITISSRPATQGAPQDDYKRPFITTVRIELPINLER